MPQGPNLNQLMKQAQQMQAEMAKAQMRFTFGDSAGYVATVTAKSTKEKGRKRSRDARPRRGVTKADIQLKWLRDQSTGALAYDRATYDATGHIATYTTVTVTGQRMQYFGTLAACRAAN